MLPHEHIIISSEGTRSGKTELRKFLGRVLGVRHGSTSDIITPRYAHMVGIPPWLVLFEREKNPHAHREGLIAEGDLMREEGRPPGLVALQTGYQVVDGVRDPREVRMIHEWAATTWSHVVHLHIVGRRDTQVVDNTDAEGLLDTGPHVLRNSGSLDQLFTRALRLVEELGLR